MSKRKDLKWAYGPEFSGDRANAAWELGRIAGIRAAALRHP